MASPLPKNAPHLWRVTRATRTLVPGGSHMLPVMLEPGKRAPAFSLPDQDGNEVRLDDLRGHFVLLWWYPKASTSG